jgi:hypothetical protein
MPLNQTVRVPHPSQSHRDGWEVYLRSGAFLLFLLATAFVLYRFPPAAYAFYPRCPIHELTGLLCPGCGATRALAALLHGNLVAALRQNALFVCLLPFAGLYLLSALHGRNWPRLPAPLLASIFVAAAVFTVARNLL